MSNAMTTTGGGTVSTTTPKTFRDQLNSPAYKEQLMQALPKGLTVERMTRVVLTAMNKTPKLLDCTRESLWESVLNCASLGLFPDALGRAYLVPYKGKCQLIIGYKGLIDLAYRSDRIASIQLVVVRKGDIFSREPLKNPPITHKIMEAEGDAFRVLTHVYSVVYLKGCDVPSIDVMSKREVDEIRARSQSGGAGPWVTDYEEMAKKTVFRRHAKVLPMSAELVQAMQVDADRMEFDTPEQTAAGRFTKDTAKEAEATVRSDTPPAPTHEDAIALAKTMREADVLKVMESHSVHTIADIPAADLPAFIEALKKQSEGARP